MIAEFYTKAFDFFANYDWNYFLFWARVISGVISLMLIISIGVIVSKITPYSKPKKIKTRKSGLGAVKNGAEPWREVLHKLESENPADWNLAVIQADSIVDRILQEMGLPGEAMGERIRALDHGRLASLDDLWEAHRIRNEVAHSPDRALTKHRAVYAVSLFEKVLQELGYLA